MVISRSTAAAGQQDLGQALRGAQEKGVRLNWILLGSLLAISLALAIYLPSLEAGGPIRRLTAEFQAVSTGAQHQIFHDRYGGAAGQLARTAAGTIEALRQAFLAELEIDEDDVGETDVGRPNPRTARARRLTRGHERLRQAADEAMGRSAKPGTAPSPTVPAADAEAPAEEPDPTATQQAPFRPNPPPSEPAPAVPPTPEPAPAQPPASPEPPASSDGSHTVPMPRRQPPIPPPGGVKPTAPPPAAPPPAAPPAAVAGTPAPGPGSRPTPQAPRPASGHHRRRRKA